jgi:TBPIP/Hop2 winged helix domain
MPAKEEGDKILDEIYNCVKSSNEPLETEEVISHIHSKVEKDASRNKVMYRLNNLRAEGKISGKMLGSGKGVWVWWHNKQKTELPERDLPKREFSNIG